MRDWLILFHIIVCFLACQREKPDKNELFTPKGTTRTDPAQIPAQSTILKALPLDRKLPRTETLRPPRLLKIGQQYFLYCHRPSFEHVLSELFRDPDSAAVRDGVVFYKSLPVGVTTNSLPAEKVVSLISTHFANQDCITITGEKAPSKWLVQAINKTKARQVLFNFTPLPDDLLAHRAPIDINLFNDQELYFHYEDHETLTINGASISRLKKVRGLGRISNKRLIPLMSNLLLRGSTWYKPKSRTPEIKTYSTFFNDMTKKLHVEKRLTAKELATTSLDALRGYSSLVVSGAVTKKTIEKIALCSFLKSIELVVSAKENELQIFSPMLSRVKNLTSLSIYRCKKGFVKHMELPPSLRRIIIQCHTAVKTTSLFKKLGRLPKLSELLFSPIDPHECAHGMSECNEIKVRDSEMAHVKSMKNLKNIDIQGPITDKGFKALLALNKIERVHIYMSKIRGKHLAAFMKKPSVREVKIFRGGVHETSVLKKSIDPIPYALRRKLQICQQHGGRAIECYYYMVDGLVTWWWVHDREIYSND